MTFDLGRALARKGEFESARLDAFAFAWRARAMRAVAVALGQDGDATARRVALEVDDAILADLVERCRADAWASLVAERGDPTPHRLA